MIKSTYFTRLVAIVVLICGALSQPILGLAPQAGALEASALALQSGKADSLPPWPCLVPSEAESAKGALSFLRHAEAWSSGLAKLSLDDLGRSLDTLLEVRNAALASPCFSNEVVADTLVRVAYVAVVERGVADRSAWRRLGSIVDRLRTIEIPLADLEAIYASERMPKLPERKLGCEESPDCYRERFTALMRGAAGDSDQFWANFRIEDMGAYQLIEKPNVAILLFRLQRTDELLSVGLAPLSAYERNLPPGEGALPIPISTEPAPNPGARVFGSKLNDMSGTIDSAVSEAIRSARSGEVAFQRGFVFSASALTEAHASIMRFSLASARPTIFQFEPAPLFLRVVNPGTSSLIVRPTTSPTGFGEGPPYPVVVHVRRSDGGEAEAVQLAPPNRFDERVFLDSWWLEVPVGELSAPVPVSADRARIGEPLFSEPGIYRFSAEIRAVPFGDLSAQRLRPDGVAAEGTVEITVRPLSSDDKECWDRIALGQSKWTLYDPEQGYLTATPIPALEAAHSWIESLRPLCGASLFRSYLELARLGIERALAIRRGGWKPAPGDIALLETLSNSPDFSYRLEAARLLEKARPYVARP